MDKKDYLLLVIAAVVTVYGFTLLTKQQPAPPYPLYEDDVAGEVQPDPGALSQPDVEPRPSGEAVAGQAPQADPSLLDDFTDLEPAEPVVLTTDEAVFTFLPETGGIATIDLPDMDITLGSADLPMMVVQPEDGEWRFSQARVTRQEADGFTVARQVLGRPLILEQTYTIVPDTYQLRCVVSLRNVGEAPVEVESLRLRAGVIPDLGTPKGFMGAAGMDQRIDYLPIGKKDPKTLALKALGKADAEDRLEWKTTDTRWLATQNKYFATIISGESAFSGIDGGSASELAMAIYAQPIAPRSYRGVVARLGDASRALTVELAAGDDSAVSVPARVHLPKYASSATFQVQLAEDVAITSLPPEMVIRATAPEYIGATTSVSSTLLREKDFVLPEPHIVGYVYLPGDLLSPGESATYDLTLYTGPKRFKTLLALGDNKESLMQFDSFLFMRLTWFEYISRGILWLLTTFHGMTHSYGIAIMLITLILRLLFWPVTHKSTVMSRKMQAIQPLAKELREKYKQDPRKLQEKTMELYRQHKVNPISGCLPAFVQIPAFFALFNVLRNAVELRHASFLWATDLALPDTIAHIPLLGLPINPLALLMGISMVLQMKVVPTSADPSQQRMMMVMSGMMIIFLYTMPSGLTLYWTANQILNIFQYRITHNIMDKREAEAAATAKSA